MIYILNNLKAIKNQKINNKVKMILMKILNNNNKNNKQIINLLVLKKFQNNSRKNKVKQISNKGNY